MSSALKEGNAKLAKELEELKSKYSQEIEEYDNLCVAVDPLRDMLGIAPPGSAPERIGGVEAMPQRVHDLAVASLRYGIRQTLAIARSHYDDINLEAISRGFPRDYSDEALDAFEQEASPFAESLAKGMKDDDDFPCKPVQ